MEGFSRFKKSGFPSEVLRAVGNNLPALPVLLPFLREAHLPSPPAHFHLYDFPDEFLVDVLGLDPPLIMRFFNTLYPKRYPIDTLQKNFPFLAAPDIGEHDLAKAASILHALLSNPDAGALADVLYRGRLQITAFLDQPDALWVEALESLKTSKKKKVDAFLRAFLEPDEQEQPDQQEEPEPDASKPVHQRPPPATTAAPADLPRRAPTPVDQSSGISSPVASPPPAPANTVVPPVVTQKAGTPTSMSSPAASPSPPAVPVKAASTRQTTAVPLSKSKAPAPTPHAGKTTATPLSKGKGPAHRQTPLSSPTPMEWDNAAPIALPDPFASTSGQNAPSSPPLKLLEDLPKEEAKELLELRPSASVPAVGEDGYPDGWSAERVRKVKGTPAEKFQNPDVKAIGDMTTFPPLADDDDAHLFPPGAVQQMRHDTSGKYWKDTAVKRRGKTKDELTASSPLLTPRIAYIRKHGKSGGRA